MIIDTVKEVLVKKTLAEQIYDILYNAIITGSLKPGEELVEHQLATKLSVSRTPIREAFSRLRAEGLVEGNNYTKMVVKTLSVEEIEEVFDLRTLMEIYAIEATIDRCTDQDIANLEDILQESAANIAVGDLIKVVEYNTLYHETLNRISGKKRVIQLLSTFRDISLRYRVFGIKTQEFAFELYQSHLRILECIKRRDKQGAVHEIKAHMEESKEATIKGFCANS